MNRVQRAAFAAITGITAGAIVLGISPVAVASNPSQAEQSAGIVEKATGVSDLTAVVSAPGAAGQSETSTVAGDITVVAPKTASGSVEVALEGVDSFSLGLPGSKSIPGIAGGDGTIVYPDAARSADLAVQPTNDGGVRTLVTIKDGSASKEWRFPLTLPEGATAELQSDGSVELTAETEGASIVIGRIAPPWAKDANGEAVPTSYRVERTTLVQDVDFTEDTAFPVVADPKVEGGSIFGTIRFNKSETSRIAAGGAAYRQVGQAGRQVAADQ